MSSYSKNALCSLDLYLRSLGLLDVEFTAEFFETLSITFESSKGEFIVNAKASEDTFNVMAMDGHKTLEVHEYYNTM